IVDVAVWRFSALHVRLLTWAALRAQACATNHGRKEHRQTTRIQNCPLRSAQAAAHLRRTVMMKIFRILAACGAVLSTVAAADAQGVDWAKVDGILGRTG